MESPHSKLRQTYVEKINALEDDLKIIRFRNGINTNKEIQFDSIVSLSR